MRLKSNAMNGEVSISHKKKTPDNMWNYVNYLSFTRLCVLVGTVRNNIVR